MRSRNDTAQLAGVLWLTMLASTCPPWPAGAAWELGRLFSTPDERARLEALRRERATGKAVMAPTDQTAAPIQPPGVTRLSVQGVVLRRGGRGSVWVNGQAVPANGGVTGEGLIVEARRAAGRRVEITLPDGTGIRLDPGQSVNLANGEVLEPYQSEALATAAAAGERASPAIRSRVAEAPGARREAGRHVVRKTLAFPGHDSPGGSSFDVPHGRGP